MRKIFYLLFLLISSISIFGCTIDRQSDATSTTTTEQTTTEQTTTTTENKTPTALDIHGYYYSKDEVALFIHTYKKLPDNYITKAEAERNGFGSGQVIGGDEFHNYEGLLPKKSGRVYTECDIDTQKSYSRGTKRIVFSNDGLIFYTSDHYTTFTQLYGDGE